MSKPKLLVIDDEEYICKQIKWGLINDYEVLIANSSKESLQIYNTHKPDIITLDLNLSPTDDHEKGFEVLKQIIAIDPYAKVIMITGHDGKENAMNSIRLGAYDYYVKPIDLNELKIILKRALYIRKLEIENKQLQSKCDNRAESFGILGNCQKIQDIISLIKRIAASELAVLIHGESGTGKELVARSIHMQSQRADKAFIPIDSGAIPETLLESELFGHEKGAFTDAYTQKKGKVELAHKGTLFFDEIAELPVALQAKLLRFLQERQIQRIGGNEFISIDVRIIAATNRSLEQEIEKNNFREDIYYRLNEITIELPSLRERGDDIIFIANHLLQKFSKEMNKGKKIFAHKSIVAMKNYQWPGNVRELENKLKRGLVLSNDKYLRPEDLGISYDNSFEKSGTLKGAKEKLEKKILLNNFIKYNGNLTKISKNLNIARSTLYDLIKKYDINL